MAIPSSILAYFMGMFWLRFRDRPWRIAIQSGLLPLTVGLLLASGAVLSRAADGPPDQLLTNPKSAIAYLLTIATVAVFMFTRIHPLWCLGVGAIIGGLGWI
jgi:chromate transporter